MSNISNVKHFCNLTDVYCCAWNDQIKLQPLGLRNNTNAKVPKTAVLQMAT